jgi:hypothetical protein
MRSRGLLHIEVRFEGGGGLILGELAPTDRPHFHSGIFFHSRQDFWRVLVDRVPPLNSMPDKTIVAPEAYAVAVVNDRLGASIIASNQMNYFPLHRKPMEESLELLTNASDTQEKMSRNSVGGGALKCLKPTRHPASQAKFSIFKKQKTYFSMKAGAAQIRAGARPL